LEDKVRGIHCIVYRYLRMSNKKYTIILWLLVFVFFLFNKKVQAQLTVNTTFTPQQLVQNVLLGPGVIATNITFTGNVLQRGTFDATSAVLGLNSGVVLSSGDINVQ